MTRRVGLNGRYGKRKVVFKKISMTFGLNSTPLGMRKMVAGSLVWRGGTGRSSGINCFRI